MGTLFLRLLLDMGRYFTWSSKPREVLAICTAKAVPSFRFRRYFFYDPEYLSGPGNRTCDLLLCRQAFYRLNRGDCLIEVNFTVIKGNKFQDLRKRRLVNA